MLYSILFFVATVIVILCARHFSIKAESFKNKYFEVVGFGDYEHVYALAIEFYCSQVSGSLSRLLFAFAVFDAMVFFEMTSWD